MSSPALQPSELIAAVRKLSRIAAATPLYLLAPSGPHLPVEWHETGESGGVRGGVEFGLLAATSDKASAVAHAT